MLKPGALGSCVAAATAAAAALAIGACWLPTGGLDPGRRADAGAPGAGGGGGDVGPECGDDVATDDEECDGADLAGSGCVDRGFSGGTLACKADCRFDTSGCEPCGNGVRGEGEQCDGSDFGGVTCRDLGFVGGDQKCDPVLCTIVGCKDAYTQDFEGDGLPLELGQDGATPWTQSSTEPHGGVRCAQSGAIGDGVTSSVSLAIAYDVDGAIGFWHRESSEACCDLLHFSIDGVEQGAWSSPTWTEATFPIAPGKHTMLWSYVKDSSIGAGSDAVWIDDVVATDGYLAE